MKGFTKKIVSVVLALTLVIGLSATTFGATWSHYFAVSDAGWYEGVDCLSFTESATGFTANINKIGWQGVWGGRVYKKISITKGKKYVISFKMKSTKIDKYVYVKVGSDQALAHSFWVFLPRGKNVTTTEVFTAACTTNDELSFGMGGEFGDRASEPTDGDASVRYAVFKKQYGKKAETVLMSKDCKPGDSASPTVISMSNFKLTSAPGKVSLKKPKAKGKKKVKVSWKKMAGAEKYEVRVGKAKKTTTKTSITMKAKKKGKQVVKVRAIVGSYKAPWSKSKKVKVK